MRRRVLLALALAAPRAAAGDEAPRYTSEATRRLAEERERGREAWWARERERQAARRFDREIERRRDATGPLIRRWEEQRESRRWR